MEELLPLIIGIVWLIYTIYNKGKKKEARKRHSEDSEEKTPSSILEQIFTRNESFKPQSYDVYDESEDSQLVEEYVEVAQKQEEETRPFLNKELADFVHEGQVAITPSDAYLMEQNTDKEDQAEKLDFDLRKAIIFSEILNAPYIGYK